MTTHTSEPDTTSSTDPGSPFSRGLMPAPLPVRFLDDDGRRVQTIVDDYAEPAPEQLVEAYRRMVIGRRFDIQATALTKQGRLAVYPSSRGQEACQVGAMLALQPGDWVFPTYRESVALVTRGIDPIEVLTLLRGDCALRLRPGGDADGAPVHAAGHPAHPRRGPGVRRGAQGPRTPSPWRSSVTARPARATSTRRSTSPPCSRRRSCSSSRTTSTRSASRCSKQTAAPSLAYKGIGYGIASRAGRRQRPDGRARGAEHGRRRTPRSGNGPFLVEAHTYRLDAHTNADDATRYRDEDEVDGWLRPRPDRPAGGLPARPRACSTTRRSRRSPAEAEAVAADVRDPHERRRRGRPAVPVRPRLRRRPPRSCSSSGPRCRPSWRRRPTPP